MNSFIRKLSVSSALAALCAFACVSNVRAEGYPNVYRTSEAVTSDQSVSRSTDQSADQSTAQNADRSASQSTDQNVLQNTDRTESVLQNETDHYEPIASMEKCRELKAENQEFAGWIKIDRTPVSFPVMYTPENPEKYLHRDFDGSSKKSGLPFIDAKCTLSPDTDNIIVYGHNMKDGSMFASLLDYRYEEYYREHPVIKLNTPTEEREYRIVSAFYDRVYKTDENVFKFYNFIETDDEDFLEAANILLDRSLYDTGEGIEGEDSLLTLVTCSYHVRYGRFVVIAKRIR